MINENTKFIYGDAFYNCTSLTSITLPDGVTNIGGSAFEKCTSLVNITIPRSVTSIGVRAFYGCSAIEGTIYYTGDIKDWCAINGLEYMREYGRSTKTLYINGKELSGDLVIPSDITYIPSYAFYNCGAITSLTIPNGVTSIGSHAFYGCTSIKNITIPNGVIKIDNYAFSGCNSLISVTIPDSVISIGSHAFYGCNLLEILTLPFIGANKDGIGDGNFGYIFGAHIPSSLKTVILTGGTIINDDAFSGDNQITSITIPNSVTSIGDMAFYSCKITSITIPNNVTHIGDKAFGWCNNLTSIIFDGTKEQWNAIEKGINWNEVTGNYTVTCTDGKLNKNGSEITE